MEGINVFMYLKKYHNFNIYTLNSSISQNEICLHLFDLFTYFTTLHSKIESESAYLCMCIYQRVHIFE